MYCSVDCREKDIYHTNCDSSLLSHTLAALRMIFGSYKIAGGVKKLVELLKNESSKTVFDFDLSNPNATDYSQNLLVAVNYLSRAAENTKIAKVAWDELVKVLPIAETTRPTSEDELLLKFLRNQLPIYFTNAMEIKETILDKVSREWTERPVGYGIFPFASLINHSCYPNVCRVTVDNKMVLVVSRPIKAGEQIYISYGPESMHHTLKEREEALEGYNFKCGCTACYYGFPELAKLPRKDHQFIPPDSHFCSGQTAIDQFKANSLYIDRNDSGRPSFEVSVLMKRNAELLQFIASETGIQS